MHYIDYTPGTIARITDYPTRHGHADVNLLSRLVVKFNFFVKYKRLTSSEKVAHFVSTFSPYALPNPHTSR